MNVRVEPWEGDLRSAQTMLGVYEAAMPLLPKAERKHAATFIRRNQKGFEGSTLKATIDGRIRGCVMLSKGSQKNMARLIGAVHPDARGHGLGSRLFSAIKQRLEENTVINTLETSVFNSCEEAVYFVRKYGFKVVDRLYWKQRAVNDPFPDWAIEKMENVERQSLHFMTGKEFEGIRADWDVAWWNLESEAIRDIPSTVRIEPMTFNEWRPKIDEPFMNRGHVLFALEDANPVGAIYLDRVDDGRINVNHMGIAKSHRRIGLSTALKIKSFELASDLGAHTVTTQNHQNNPMLKINQRLGFRDQDVMLLSSKKLNA